MPTFRASCPLCGSLGNYSSQEDANSAETQHQLNKHTAPPTPPVEDKPANPRSKRGEGKKKR